jgi:hypothetical protein
LALRHRRDGAIEEDGMTRSTPALLSILDRYYACRDACKWAGKRRASRASWCACERGDWLLWIAAAVGVDRRIIVRAACAVARTALVYVPAAETRPLRCIEIAEAWCEGRATIEEVRAAAGAAEEVSPYAVDYAADAAVDVARAADDADDAENEGRAACASYAVRNAAYAAYAAQACDYDVSLRESARIVRRMIHWETVAKAAGLPVRTRRSRGPK